MSGLTDLHCGFAQLVDITNPNDFFGTAFNRQIFSTSSPVQLAIHQLFQLRITTVIVYTNGFVRAAMMHQIRLRVPCHSSE
ncbi:hypothetical protein D3C74_467210 [compost metagenome]